jgi:MoaA/NifB/PqqE/SkfB family radical SAM enzyme
MRYRYKIRQEAKGAFVFDRIERSVFPLKEEELSLVLSANQHEEEIRELPEELRSFFKPPDDIDANQGPGRANFSIIKPLCASETWLVAPNRLYLELTRQCKLCCRMCYNAAGRALPNELTTHQFKALLDEMDAAGVFEVRFTGGEPTQRPDFFEILDYAIKKDFYVSLATNGVWNLKLTQEICRRQIDDVIVSLDGPEEINDWFRVGGSFKATLETIRSLKEAGFKKVRINTVISHANWQEVEPLFQICKEYDLLLIDFIHPRPFGRGATRNAKELTLNAEETLKFNRLVKRLRQKYPGVKVVMDFDLLAERELPRHPIVPRIKACPAGREFAFVSPQGYVFPCGVAPVNDIALMSPKEKELFIAGNVLETSLLEIWHQSPVWEAFRALAKCKPEKCFSCQFWGKKCFGTCPIGAYYHAGRLNGEDPYCYSHLL